MRHLGRWPVAAAAGVAAVAALYLLRGAWLPRVGSVVVECSGAGPTVRGDAILVPQADWVEAPGGMEQLEHAHALLRQGVGRVVFMTCPHWYGVSSCRLAEEASARRRSPGIKITPIPTERLADSREAELALAELSQRGIKSAVVVLPSYKSRRLGRIYREVGRRHGVEVNVACVEVQWFNPSNWWRRRESCKVFVCELLRWLRVL